MHANRPVAHGLSNRPVSDASREPITDLSAKESADLLFDLLIEVICHLGVRLGAESTRHHRMVWRR